MYDNDDNDEPGFFARYRIAIGIGLVVCVMAGVGIWVCIMAGKSKPPRKPEEIVIHLEPPPPAPPTPPPPPPKATPPPEQKMVEQPQVKPDEQKPKEAPKAADHPPGPPGPPATGPASDFGLAGGGGGGGGEIGGGGGSKYGWYAAKIAATVKRALDANNKTREARFHVKVRIWADTSGHITRATLAGSSGDPAVDDAIKNQVLVGLNLPEAPPTDMPMPIVMMLNAQRSN